MKAPAFLALALAACGPLGDKTPAKEPEARLVVVEKGALGGRLVLIDERGERLRTLTESAEVTLDVSPAWSPDGKWIAFSSTRGRELGEFSIWIVAAAGGEPVRLTDGPTIDMAPRWSPDGRALVFAAKGGADVDLVLVDVQTRALTRLTNGGPLEHQPAWSPDGSTIVYVAQGGDGASKLMRMPAAGGEGSALTAGPRDAWPTFTPDGRAIVYAAPAPGREDRDLWIVDAAGGTPRRLLDDPLADEAAPRLSRDGRFVFASSVVRAPDGKGVFGVVVVADLRAEKPAWRALVERRPIERLGVDPRPAALAARELAAAPSLRAAIEDAFARAASAGKE